MKFFVVLLIIVAGFAALALLALAIYGLYAGFYFIFKLISVIIHPQDKESRNPKD